MKIPSDSAPESSKFFKLSTDNSDFACRSNDVFASLGTAETKHSEFLDDLETTGLNRSCHKADPVIVSEDINKCQRFNRPLPKTFKRRANRTPGYKLQPSKWKKYSLADVSDVSQSSNKAAALNFLDSLKARKHGDSATASDDSSCDDSVVFKKPTSSSSAASAESSYKSSKLCMPEYVVGQKPKKKMGSCLKKPIKIDESVVNKAAGCGPSFEVQDDQPSSDVLDESEEKNIKETEKISFKKKVKKSKRCFRQRDNDD